LRFQEYVPLLVYIGGHWLTLSRVFNTGSPYNVVAGQGPRNADELVAHYKKANAEVVEKQAKVLEEKEG
jgi:hypothetical protein